MDITTVHRPNINLLVSDGKSVKSYYVAFISRNNINREIVGWYKVGFVEPCLDVDGQILSLVVELASEHLRNQQQQA